MNNFCLIKNKYNTKDNNGYGSINYLFSIQQNFITYQDFIIFLNDIEPEVSNLNIYDLHLQKNLNYENHIFTAKDGVDIYAPINYINFKKLRHYCNWMNKKEINSIEESKSNKYWIPSYNEFYKSVYYNPYYKKYSIFPNNKNNVNNYKVNENHISAYGLINAGFKYFNILKDEDIGIQEDKYLIAGGSSNRHTSNAKAGVKYHVSSNYHSAYISGRLCKKCETHTITLLLYDVYGDGWQNNHIRIEDSSNNILADNINLKEGYGPFKFELEIEKLEKYIYVIYVKNNDQHYENYYEVYKDSELLFKSNEYETPPIKNKVFINK